MIPRRKKICKGCNQPQHIFSSGLCERCWNRNRLTEARNKPSERRSPSQSTEVPPEGIKSKNRPLIKPRTDKRKQQEAEYKKICDEIDREAIENKQMDCFFCGKPIKGSVHHHHLDGRDGYRLTRKEYIKRVHPSCHVDYHDKSFKSLPWAGDYLERVKRIDEKVYLRDLWKLDK